MSGRFLIRGKGGTYEVYADCTVTSTRVDDPFQACPLGRLVNRTAGDVDGYGGDRRENDALAFTHGYDLRELSGVAPARARKRGPLLWVTLSLLSHPAAFREYSAVEVPDKPGRHPLEAVERTDLEVVV